MTNPTVAVNHHLDRFDWVVDALRIRLDKGKPITELNLKAFDDSLDVLRNLVDNYNKDLQTNHTTK